MEFYVDDNGKISGTLSSLAYPQSNFELTGFVDLHGNVTIDYIYSDSKVGEFKGKMTDLSVSGSWSMSTSAGSHAGNWRASKI